jgi:hypothetical protein
MSLPSHASDVAAELVLSVARCKCQVILVIVLPSHAGVGDVEAILPWRDVDVESC